MKDTLQDLIDHTSALGFIEVIKVVGSTTETTIAGVAENKNVILTGKLKNPHPELVGTFGMPNLAKLKTIIGFDDYDQDAKITMKHQNRNGVDVPELIHFETKTGDFVNEYRLMAQNVIEGLVKNVTFHGGNKWDVEFTPGVNSILRLKKQNQANSDEKHFMTRLDGTDIRVFFGDPNTHNGNFVFASNVSGKISKSQYWPVQEVISILNLPGDKTIKIMDQGAMEITVDSGLGVYSYLLPAQTK